MNVGDLDVGCVHLRSSAADSEPDSDSGDDRGRGRRVLEMAPKRRTTMLGNGVPLSMTCARRSMLGFECLARIVRECIVLHPVPHTVPQGLRLPPCIGMRGIL